SGAPSGVLLRRRAALFVTVRMMDGLRQPAPRGQPVLAATRSPAAARGAWPARHARGRRSAPHEPAQPVRVPHGGGPAIGILSDRNIVKTPLVENNGAGVQKRCAVGTRKTKSFGVVREAK